MSAHSGVPVSGGVAALYVDPRGPYPKLLGPEMCWDEERDARTYAGPWPVVAHPPCGPWGRLKHLHKRPQDRDLAPAAVDQVRRWGGVLEHPADSQLWARCDLPGYACFPDQFGGQTIRVDQVELGPRLRQANVALHRRAPAPHLRPIPRPEGDARDLVRAIRAKRPCWPEAPRCIERDSPPDPHRLRRVAHLPRSFRGQGVPVSGGVFDPGLCGHPEWNDGMPEDEQRFCANCLPHIDFPTAWKMARLADDHDPKCSFVVAKRGMLCDCHVVYGRKPATPTAGQTPGAKGTER